MLNFGQKLPIATLSKQKKKIQNDPVGRLGAIEIFNFTTKLAYLFTFLPISRQPEVIRGHG